MQPQSLLESAGIERPARQLGEEPELDRAQQRLRSKEGKTQIEDGIGGWVIVHRSMPFSRPRQLQCPPGSVVSCRVDLSFPGQTREPVVDGLGYALDAV